MNEIVYPIQRNQRKVAEDHQNFTVDFVEYLRRLDELEFGISKLQNKNMDMD